MEAFAASGGVLSARFGTDISSAGLGGGGVIMSTHAARPLTSHLYNTRGEPELRRPRLRFTRGEVTLSFCGGQHRRG